MHTLDDLVEVVSKLQALVKRTLVFYVAWVAAVALVLLNI